MIYSIPKCNYESLKTKVDKISRKGVEVTFNIISTELVNISKTPGKEILYPFYNIDVDGMYIINGWEFVGTIQYVSDGVNVVRNSTNGRVEIPEYYRSCECKCDHCNTIRRRNDTYLIRNIESGEFKQVGKNCLMEYTNGLDAKVCADFEQFFKEVKDNFYDEDMLCMYNSVSNYIDSLKFKRFAFEEIVKFGYLSKESGDKATLNKLFDVIFDKQPSKEYDSLIDEMNKWVESVDAKSDYMYNCKALWTKEYYERRDLSMIASFINVFLKDKARKVAGSNSNFVGKIGDKVEIKVKSVSTLYSKGSYDRVYDRFQSYDECLVFRIVGEDNNIYIWSTTSYVEENNIIRATVKDFKEYKGEKQTIITRGKVLQF